MLPHLSPNRLEGSLCDTSLDSLLAACRKSLVTGTLSIEAYSGDASVELRAGAVENAQFGALRGEAAVHALRDLHDGLYELRQRLPDFDGKLGGSAQFESRDGSVGLIALMRHCEDNALSCTLTIVDNFDRGQIVYRAGEIVEVNLNGVVDDEAIVALTRMTSAKFLVSAPPLELDVLGGWPAISREPTQPFAVQHLAMPSPPPTDAERLRAPTAAERPSALPGIGPRANARGTDPDALIIRANTSPSRRPPRAASFADGPSNDHGFPWMLAAGGAALLAISLVYILTVLAMGRTP